MKALAVFFILIPLAFSSGKECQRGLDQILVPYQFIGEQHDDPTIALKTEKVIVATPSARHRLKGRSTTTIELIVLMEAATSRRSDGRMRLEDIQAEVDRHVDEVKVDVVRDTYFGTAWNTIKLTGQRAEIRQLLESEFAARRFFWIGVRASDATRFAKRIGCHVIRGQAMRSEGWH